MGRGEDDYARRHRNRIDQFAQQVYLAYVRAAEAAIMLGYKSKFDPRKPFSFDMEPRLRKEVSKVFATLSKDVFGVISKGITEEWMLAEQKNDDLVKSIFTKSMPVELNRRFLGRNLEALRAFQNQKIDGLGLSEKIWNYTGDFKSEVELAIDTGLLEGRSATSLASDMKQFLKDPDKLFRRVRDARGILHLSKAAANYHPGQGKYRSSYKNALRLTRTVINDAYRESDHNRWQQLDFVVGIEVRRSNNPYPCPTCDALKGRYPKEYKFRSVHPACRCYAVSILATKDEINRLTEMILNGEDTSKFRSVNQVTSMPAGWVNYITKNRDTLLSRKSVPFFIKDNFKNGDLLKGLKFALPEVQKVAKQLDLKSMIKGDLPTDKEIRNIIMAYGEAFPENFDVGLKKVAFLNSKGYLMAHRKAFKQKGDLVIGSEISISKHTFSVKINDKSVPYNSLEELRGAFGAIKAGKNLTYLQEDAIESLWHEILHAKTKNRRYGYDLEKMETVNEFVARHTYDALLRAFGGKASHKKQIIEDGVGYRKWVKGFRERLKKHRIPEAKALRELKKVLLEDYSKIPTKLQELFDKYPIKED